MKVGLFQEHSSGKHGPYSFFAFRLDFHFLQCIPTSSAFARAIVQLRLWASQVVVWLYYYILLNLVEFRTRCSMLDNNHGLGMEAVGKSHVHLAFLFEKYFRSFFDKWIACFIYSTLQSIHLAPDSGIKLFVVVSSLYMDYYVEATAASNLALKFDTLSLSVLGSRVQSIPASTSSSFVNVYSTSAAAMRTLG